MKTSEFYEKWNKLPTGSLKSAIERLFHNEPIDYYDKEILLTKLLN